MLNAFPEDNAANANTRSTQEGVFECFNPIDHTYHLFQNYYRIGLRSRRLVATPLGFLPARLLSRLQNKLTGLARLGNALAYGSANLEKWQKRHHPHVGQYMFRVDGEEFTFAIDTDDKKELMSEEICRDVDLYFKCNYWPSQAYPDNVLPIISGSGSLSAEKLRYIRSLRDTPKQYDLFFMSRLWSDSLEHNVRLFQALTNLQAEKFLFASSPSYHSRPDTKHACDRIAALGVPCSDRTLSFTEMWQALAASELLFVRMGKHFSVPWRVSEYLAVGGAIVIDSEPESRWYQPLVRDQNYFCLDIPRNLGDDAAPEAQYEAISEKLQTLLENKSALAAMAQANRTYFDTYASPSRVIDYIVRSLQR